MIKIIFTIILICLFFFSGKIVQALKKTLSLITSILLKVASFFGIKISTKEKVLKVSDEFKEAYKGIKIVKLSKKNLKQVSSIDWISLALFLISLTLIFCNLAVITGNAISNWLYSLLASTKIVKSAIDMNTLYTAVLFSILSFSATKLLQRWKDTKQKRLEKKHQKLKEQALKLMDSKELLDNAKKKDKEKLDSLK